MEHAGDHFVGRVASGLPLLKKEFCVLPPYFRADLPDAQSILIEETYKNVFPNDTLWGDHMRAICIQWPREGLQNLAYASENVPPIAQRH